MGLERIAAPPPRSFLFYIVADVGSPGTNSSYRPLAVTYRQGHSPGPGRTWSVSKDRVQEVISDCASIVAVLADPTNRVPLEAELASATAWYRSGRREAELERNEIPDAQQPQFEWGFQQNAFDSERPELPWADGIREFPFISSCVRLALNRPDRSHHGIMRRRVGDVQEQPLETAFSGNKLEYGMVVIDISDLDSVRYGIVGRCLEYLAEITPGFDVVDMDKPEREPVIQLEKSRSRRPLSGTAYMKKHLHDKPGGEAIELLASHPVVTLQSLDYIWPRSTRNSSSPGIEGPSMTGRHPTPDDESSITSEDAHLEEAVARVIRDAVDGKDEPGISPVHRETLDHPSFRLKLLTRLVGDPGVLDLPACPSSVGFLLRLAYAGKPHLNWVAYTKLTYEDMAAAIASTELQAATALSICVDERGDDSPAPLLEILARFEAIRNLFLFQGPARANDDESSLLFSQMCTSPLASRLLGGSRNIYITAAFSAPLRRKIWLPADLRGASSVANRTAAESLVAAFPAQYMFVRQQFRDGSLLGDNGQESQYERFRPCHFFLGDALLKPERLVAGFSQYCRSVLSDRFLFSFATEQITRHNDGAVFQGTKISPIPAETFAMPETCSISSPSSSPASSSQTQVDCWPLFRGLEPNGWVLLVSHEWYVTPDTRRRRAEFRAHGRSGLSDIGVPFVRYAFLRARKLLAWPVEDTTTGPEGIPSLDLETLVNQDSGYIEVIGGATEFLRETAPETDGRLAERSLGESARILRERWPQGLGEGMDFISTLNESTARNMLRDFLEDAVHVRGNLRTAMRAKPHETAWYLDLLIPSPASPWQPGANPGKRRMTTTETADEPTHHRNGTVFKSLHEADVRGCMPLGTEGPNTLGPEDYSTDFIFSESLFSQDGPI